ncbi:MAG TPA: BON domain-containing protein [Usitatibacter sp.]|nr:BON domain-containing protein [Usitatibacter sp.]
MTRSLLRLVALALLVPTLQACFPLAATGVVAGGLMAADRRTTGIYIEDENIEFKILARVKDQFPGAHINATSFNRRVLVSGEAPSEAVRKQVEDAVRGIESVREVVNEMQVAGASSLASRGNDALITSNVKARMVNNRSFAPNHVKVVTEAGVVYLMGIVTPDEGEAAVEVARTTSGVSRVVKVFEYMR